MLNVWILVTVFFAQGQGNLIQEHQGQSATPTVYYTEKACKDEAMKKTGPLVSTDPYYPIKWTAASCHPITIRVL